MLLSDRQDRHYRVPPTPPPTVYVSAPSRLILPATTAPLRYHTLKLIHFYTAGSDEVKCWTIRDGWTAPKAAGTIHTDFERGFIKAEVYNWDDWKAVLNEDASHERGKLAEASVKEAGKYRQASRAAHLATLPHARGAPLTYASLLSQEGKNYVVKDADVIFFKFNVTADKKK